MSELAGMVEASLREKTQGRIRGSKIIMLRRLKTNLKTRMRKKRKVLRNRSKSKPFVVKGTTVLQTMPGQAEIWEMHVQDLVPDLVEEDIPLSTGHSTATATTGRAGATLSGSAPHHLNNNNKDNLLMRLNKDHAGHADQGSSGWD